MNEILNLSPMKQYFSSDISGPPTFWILLKLHEDLAKTA